MNIGSHYKLYHFIPWTRIKIYKMLILSIVPTALFYFLDWKWLAIPWVPVALLGTAAAFISGFKIPKLITEVGRLAKFMEPLLTIVAVLGFR